MSIEELAYGKFVVWKGLRAIVVDIRYHGRNASVQIRVAGGHLHWTSAGELREVAS